MLKYKISSLVIIFSLFSFYCVGTRQYKMVKRPESLSKGNTIQTQWDKPVGSKMRIVDAYSPSSKIIFEREIPTIIPLKKIWDVYYVEILTKENNYIFGELEILNVTKITELSTVKIEITDNIIEQVLDSQVSKISVTDPSAQLKILELRIGNRMPPKMEKIYSEKKFDKLKFNNENKE